MPKAKFDYQGAIQDGYTDDEILEFFKSDQKNFDYEGALADGYSPAEINQFLSQPEERSNIQKGARIGENFLASVAENALLPYELGVALPLSSESGQKMNYLQNVGSDIEDMLTQKAYGNWTPQDEEQLNNLYSQIENPSTADQYVKTADVGVRDIYEDITGRDLEQETALEKTASWLGYLKNPSKGWKELSKQGISPKLLKELKPGTKFMQSLGAGTFMQMAEDNQYGPAGKMMAAVVGHGVGSIPSAALSFAKNPKKFLAQATSYLTGANSNKNLAKELTDRGNAKGVQLDAGTLTDSSVIKWLQARLSQSSLSGEALKNFKNDLYDQIINNYESLGNTIAESAFSTKEQASEALKEALKTSEMRLEFPDTKRQGRSLEGRIDIQERPPYQQEFLNSIAPQEFQNNYQAGETLKTVAQDIKRPLKEEFERTFQNLNEQMRLIEAPQPELVENLTNFVNENRGSLLLGESTAEARVLNAAEELLQNLEVNGSYRGVTLDQLNKTKRTLADVPNWEIGTSDFSSRYKELVRQVDEAIERTLRRENPELLELFEQNNAEYSAFKDMYENKNVVQLFEPKNENYNKIYQSFINDPDKLRSLEDIFWNHPRGEEILNQIKRDYAQRVTSATQFTPRDARNLVQELGPQYEAEILRYANERAIAEEATGQIPRRPERLNLEFPNERGRGKEFKAKESEWFKRRKFYESIKNKSPEETLKNMNTVGGIKKLEKMLNLTDEGKELFQKIKRYKLEQMIGNKMKTDMTKQVKLGKFSELLKSSEDKAIVKELLGEEAYKELRRLQKDSSLLSKSASEFFNASQSGSVAADVGLYTSAVIGIVTGQPWLVGSALATTGGMRILSKLLTDKTFLKYLEQARSAKNQASFLKTAKKMEPIIKAAVMESQQD